MVNLGRVSRISQSVKFSLYLLPLFLHQSSKRPRSFKQSNFIIPGYLSDIKEDDGSSEGSVGTTSGDIATVDNRFPEIIKRKNRKI